MELQKCCVCKMNKEDVKHRVTDDLRCDLCIFKTTNQLNTGPNPTEEDSEVGATGLDDSRTICLLYENLLEKIVVKNRTHRRKIKTRIQWRKNLDSLKRLPYACIEEQWHLDRTYQTYNEPYVQNRRSDLNLQS